MNNISDLYIKHITSYYRDNLFDILKFGRLPVHEALKLETLRFGERMGFTPIPEYRVAYSLGVNKRNGRIDAVWKDQDKNIATFEFEEGICSRGIGKLVHNQSINKFFVMFDVRKMMMKRVNKMNFTKLAITPILLLGR